MEHTKDRNDNPTHGTRNGTPAEPSPGSAVASPQARTANPREVPTPNESPRPRQGHSGGDSAPARTPRNGQTPNRAESPQNATQTPRGVTASEPTLPPIGSGGRGAAAGAAGGGGTDRVSFLLQRPTNASIDAPPDGFIGPFVPSRRSSRDYRRRASSLTSLSVTSRIKRQRSTSMVDTVRDSFIGMFRTHEGDDHVELDAEVPINFSPSLPRESGMSHTATPAEGMDALPTPLNLTTGINPLSGDHQHADSSDMQPPRVQVWTTQQLQANLATALLHKDVSRVGKLLRRYNELKAREMDEEEDIRLQYSLTSSPEAFPHGHRGRHRIELVDDEPDMQERQRNYLLDRVYDRKTGYTLMHIAVLTRSLPIVNECLRAGSEVHAVEDKLGDTPLTLAMRRFPNCVESLFSAGRRVDVHRVLTSREQSMYSRTMRRTSVDVHRMEVASHRPAGTSRRGSIPSVNDPSYSTPVDQVLRHMRHEGAIRNQNLLFCVVTADESTPPWPGRLNFIKLLVERYYVRAGQEDAFGFTPIMWTRAHEAFLGHEQTEQIVAYLKRATRREDQNPRDTLIRHLSARPSALRRKSRRGSRGKAHHGMKPSRKKAKKPSSPQRNLLSGTPEVGVASPLAPHSSRKPSPSASTRVAIPSSSSPSGLPTALKRKGGSQPQSPTTRVHVKSTSPARSPTTSTPWAFPPTLTASPGVSPARKTQLGKGLQLQCTPLVTTDVDRLRYFMQGPLARVICVAVLLIVHILGYTACSVPPAAQCELWITLGNFVCTNWSGSAFFMGLAHLGCLVVGAGVGFVVVHYVLGQLVGHWLLRLPCLGAQSGEEKVFQRHQFGLFYVAFFKPRNRPFICLLPVGVVLGIYGGAKGYNALLHTFWSGQVHWAEIRPVLEGLGDLTVSRGLFCIKLLSDWALLWFICDLMYQQGSLNVHLPHYRFGNFAHWIDSTVYPWLWSHHFLCMAQLRLAQPSALGSWPCLDALLADSKDMCEKDSSRRHVKSVASAGRPAAPPGSHNRAKRATRHTTHSRTTSGTQDTPDGSAERADEAHTPSGFYRVQSLPLAQVRLWVFWFCTLAGWTVVVTTFALLISNGPSQTTAVSFHASRVSLRIFCDACSILLLCIMALQEWTWPTLQKHLLLELPGVGLCEHQAWALLLILWLIATLDVCDICAHASYVWEVGTSGDRWAALGALTPACVGMLVFIIALLSSSLRLAGLRAMLLESLLPSIDGSEDESSSNGSGSSEDDQCIICTCHAECFGLRCFYQWWAAFSEGAHMYRLPVPEILGLLHYLYPKLPQWKTLREQQEGWCTPVEMKASLEDLVRMIEATDQTIAVPLSHANADAWFDSDGDNVPEEKADWEAVTAAKSSTAASNTEEVGLFDAKRNALLTYVLHRRRRELHMKWRAWQSEMLAYAGETKSRRRRRYSVRRRERRYMQALQQPDNP